MSDQGDSALLARFRSGGAQDREAAFEELFRRHRGSTYRLCLSLTGSRADAEDALQEIFLAVYHGLGDFRGEARLSTWIYRIAIRLALRQRARAARRPSPPMVVERDTDNPVARYEQADQLLAALQRVSAEHRIVLTLFALHDMTQVEIAEVLGVPEGTIWSRLSNARKKLADALGE